MSSYVSFDGGETWEGPNQLRYFQEDFSAAGDPVVAFDRDGNVYMASISLGLEEFRLGSLVSATEISSIVVSKSEDDGLTWGDVRLHRALDRRDHLVPDETGRERGEVAADFLDKPWMAIGPDPQDPERDIIYIAYTEFKTRYTTLYADELPFLTSPITETTIRLVRSSDGGATWSDPIGVSPTVFQAEGASEEGEGGASAADAQTDDGEINQQAQQEGEAAGTGSRSDGSGAATRGHGGRHRRCRLPRHDARRGARRSGHDHGDALRRRRSHLRGAGPGRCLSRDPLPTPQFVLPLVGHRVPAGHRRTG